MANGQENQVRIVFTGDTTQLKKEINSLRSSLNSLGTTGSGIKSGAVEKLTSDIREGMRAASELQAHLENAVNVNTGKLDLRKFNASLKESGKTLDQYAYSMSKLGDDGVTAFNNFAMAVAKSEVPMFNLNSHLQNFMTTLANTAKWQATSSIVHGIMKAFSTAYNYAQDLNESLNNIRIVTGKSIEEMKEFAVEANNAAKALRTTTTTYTDAALIYYQQGLSSEEVKERTDITIKMANAVGESAETISDQMTAVWNNFADGSKNLEYFADVLVKLGAYTASSTDEITEGLEKFSSVAQTIGLSYEYAASSLATITAVTRESANVAGTALKTLFSRIQGLNLGETQDDGTTLNNYSEALYKVGVNIKDTNGEVKDMDVILDELGSKWKNLAKDQQLAVAQTVAGVRQYNQLMTLMNNWDYFEELVGVSKSSEGSLDEQAEIFAESWEAARKKVTAALESIYQKLFDDSGFIKITEVVGGFIEIIDKVIDSLGGVKGVLFALGTLVTSVFQQKIAAGLKNAGLYLSSFTAKGRAAMEATRKNALNAAYSQYDKYMGPQYSTATQARAWAGKSEVMYADALSAVRSKLSKESLTYFEIQQQALKTGADQVIQESEKLTVLEQEVATAKRAYEIEQKRREASKENPHPILTEYESALYNANMVPEYERQKKEKEGNDFYKKYLNNGNTQVAQDYGKYLDKQKNITDEEKQKRISNITKTNSTSIFSNALSGKKENPENYAQFAGNKLREEAEEAFLQSDDFKNSLSVNTDNEGMELLRKRYEKELKGYSEKQIKELSPAQKDLVYAFKHRDRLSDIALGRVRKTTKQERDAQSALNRFNSTVTSKHSIEELETFYPGIISHAIDKTVTIGKGKNAVEQPYLNIDENKKEKFIQDYINDKHKEYQEATKENVGAIGDAHGKASIGVIEGDNKEGIQAQKRGLLLGRFDKNADNISQVLSGITKDAGGDGTKLTEQGKEAYRQQLEKSKEEINHIKEDFSQKNAKDIFGLSEEEIQKKIKALQELETQINKIEEAINKSDKTTDKDVFDAASEGQNILESTEKTMDENAQQKNLSSNSQRTFNVSRQMGALDVTYMNGNVQNFTPSTVQEAYGNTNDNDITMQNAEKKQEEQAKEHFQDQQKFGGIMGRFSSVRNNLSGITKDLFNNSQTLTPQEVSSNLESLDQLKKEYDECKKALEDYLQKKGDAFDPAVVNKAVAEQEELEKAIKDTTDALNTQGVTGEQAGAAAVLNDNGFEEAYGLATSDIDQNDEEKVKLIRGAFNLGQGQQNKEHNMAVEEAERLRLQKEMEIKAAQETASWNNIGSVAMQTASQVGMAVSSINSFISTMEDPDTTGWDKFSQALITFPMLVPGLKSSVESISGIITAKIKLANEGVGKSTGLIAKLAKTTELSSAAITGWIAGIIAVIIVAIKIISSLIERAKNNSLEKRVEAAKTATEEAKTAAEEAETAYSNLLDTIDKYSDAADKIKKLTVGTEAFKDAVKEANEHANELITTWKSVDWHVDSSTGLIVFEDNAFSDLENEYKTEEEEAQASYQANQSYQLQLETQLESEKLTEKIGDFLMLDENLYDRAATFYNQNGATVTEEELESIDDPDKLQSYRDEHAWAAYFPDDNELKEMIQAVYRYQNGYSQLLTEAKLNEIAESEDISGTLAQTLKDMGIDINSSVGKEYSSEALELVIALRDNKNALENNTKATLATDLIDNDTYQNSNYKQEILESLADTKEQRKDSIKKDFENYTDEQYQDTYGESLGWNRSHGSVENEGGIYVFRDSEGEEVGRVAKSDLKDKTIELEYQNRLDTYVDDAQSDIANLYAGQSEATQSFMTAAITGDFSGLTMDNIQKMQDSNVEWNNFLNDSQWSAIEKIMGKEREQIQAELAKSAAGVQDFNNLLSSTTQDALNDTQWKENKLDQTTYGTQVTVAEQMNQLYQKGGKEDLEAYTTIADKVGPEDMEDYVDVLEEFDWSEGPVAFREALEEAGIEINVTNAELKAMCEAMENAHADGLVEDFETIKSDIQTIYGIMKDLEPGKTISAEDHDKIVETNPELDEYFQEDMINGTYRYMGPEDIEGEVLAPLIEEKTGELNRRNELMKSIAESSPNDIGYDENGDVITDWTNGAAIFDTYSETPAILANVYKSGGSRAEAIKAQADYLLSDIDLEKYVPLIGDGWDPESLKELIQKVGNGTATAEDIKTYANIQQQISDLTTEAITNNENGAYDKEIDSFQVRASSATEQFGSQAALEKAYNETSKTKEDTETYRKGLLQLALAYDSCADEVEAYYKARKSGDTKAIEKAEKDLANAIKSADWNKAATEAREYLDVLEDNPNDVEETAEAYSGLQEILKDTFGIYADKEFIKNHIDSITEMMNSTGQEFLDRQRELQLEAVKEMSAEDAAVMLGIDYSGMGDEDVEAFSNKWMTVKNYLENNPIELNAEGEADMTGLVKQLLLAGYTAGEVAKILAALGQTELRYEWASSDGELKYGGIDSLSEEKRFELIASGELTVTGIYPDGFNPNMTKTNDSGGSSKEKKDKNDEIERYHEIKNTLEDLETQYDRLKKARDRAYGMTKVKLIQQEIDKTKELAAAQQQYMTEINNNLISDQSALAALGATFDELGNVNNYDELMSSWIDEFNGSLTDEAEEAYNDKKEALEQYEETHDLWQEEYDKLIDYYNQIVDLELEAITVEVDFKIELSEKEIERVEYEIEKLTRSRTLNIDLQINRLGDYIPQYLEQAQIYQEAIQKIYDSAMKYGLTELTEDQYSTVQDYQSKLLELNTSMLEQATSVEEKFEEELDKMTERFDEAGGRFEKYGSVLDHFSETMELLGLNTKDFSTYQNLLSQRLNTSVAAMENNKKQLELYNQTIVDTQEALARAVAQGDNENILFWEETLRTTQVAAEEAYEAFLSSWKDTVKEATEYFDSKVEAIIQKYKDNLFTDSLDNMKDKLEKVSTVRERYLDDIERWYQISKLNREIEKEIDDTDNLSAKRRLAEMQKEILKYQEEGVKMSQYDLDIATARYELLIAEIALEEARNAKNTVQLKRDSEGNWGYVYTADADNIAQAEQTYEDKLHDLNTKALEYKEKMESQVIDALNNLFEELGKLDKNAGDYQERAWEIYQHYYDQLQYLAVEFDKALADSNTTLADTVFADEGIMTDFLTYITNLMDSVKSAPEELIAQYKDLQDTIKKVNESAGIDSDNLSGDVVINIDWVNGKTEELAEDMTGFMDDISSSIAKVIDTIQTWKESYLDAINDMIAANEQWNLTSYQVPSGYSSWSEYFAANPSEINWSWLPGQGSNSSTGSSSSSGGYAGYSIGNLSSGSSASLTSTGSREDAIDFNSAYVVYSVDGGKTYQRCSLREWGDSMYDYIKSNYSAYEASAHFDTGGYTGSWGSSGRIATLHEKELVLNKTDTKNILDAVDIMRQTQGTIDAKAHASSLSSRLASQIRGTLANDLNQNVSIQASFPSVTNNHEIEDAFNNLVNAAAQYANKKI